MVCFEDVTIPLLKVKLQTTGHFQKVIDIYLLFTGKSAHSLLNKEFFSMELKTKIWMTGSLDWFGFIDNEEIFLGHRNFPNPPEEGDAWTCESGDMFKIIDGEIKKVGHTEPPKKYW